MEACLFKCQICWDFETTVGKELAEHISSRHQMSEADYEEAFESLMFAPSHVECPRCEGTVLHCEKDISEHQVNDCCTYEDSAGGLVMSYMYNILGRAAFSIPLRGCG